MDYPINDDFKKLKMMTFPIVEGFAPAAEKVLGVFVNVNHSDKNVSVEKFSINSDGASLPCLLYSPRGKNGKLPLVVYYHGGGFIYKAAPYHYRLLKEYCLGANCMVLCVDYRNTPKYNFNQIFPDCYSTLEWAVKNADRIGADLNKFAVAGDSAGGCLAAATVLKARDEGLVNLCGMLLVYPVLDSGVSTESMKKFVDTPVWNSILNMFRLHPQAICRICRRHTYKQRSSIASTMRALPLPMRWNPPEIALLWTKQRAQFTASIWRPTAP